MDLGLNELQQMLKTTAHEFLERECPDAVVRAMEEDEKGYTPDLWQKMASQGWLGLVVPEEYGGTGGDFVDLCVLLEQMGRFLVPGPFRSTVVTGAIPIKEFGNDQQKQQLLPQIAQGELMVTMAQTEPSATYEASGIQMEARAQGDGYVLNGTKLFVHNANVADYLIVAARTSRSDDPTKGITCFLVPGNAQGVTVSLLKTIASDKQCEVLFKDVQVGKDAVLGKVDGGWEVVQRTNLYGAAAECAWMLGGAQAVLEMTVEYAKQRVQFGRPIGSFQAIQHHCANMATDVEGSRYITYQAAWRLAEGLDAEREVAMAKAWVSEAYRRVCALGHQCHGAIGFTQEHNMQLYFRRAKAAELAFGDADFHRELVAQALGL